MSMSMTDYTLHFENRPGYLFARVEGPRDTLEISLGYWRDIAAEIERRGATALLVVEELEQRSDPEDAAQVIAALPGLGLGRVRIAYVDALEDVDLLLQEQAEALLIGLQGRVFGSTESAERWLLGAVA
jgi:hypothetical protein